MQPTDFSNAVKFFGYFAYLCTHIQDFKNLMSKKHLFPLISVLSLTAPLLAFDAGSANAGLPDGNDGCRSITLPHVEESYSRNFLLRGIEISDSATVMDYSFLHRPGYWCSLDGVELVGDKTGKSYPLARVNGYILGEKRHMPASGRFDFIMTFPPLDAEDTSVTLFEITDNGKNIPICKGVDLTGAQTGKYKTHLTGTHEGKAGYVGFLKSGINPLSTPITWIPVDNGEFDCVVYSDELLAYDIINGPNLFQGGWTSNTFFTENADIGVDFKLQEDSGGPGEMEFHDIKIYAPSGSLSESHAMLDSIMTCNYYQAPAVLLRDSLKNAEKYYIPEYYRFTKAVEEHPELRDSLSAEFNKEYGGRSLRTPEGERAENAVADYFNNERLRYLCENAIRMDNIAGLFAITRESYSSDDNSILTDAYIRGYRGKFPESEYAIHMEKLTGSNEITPGTPFNDFSAKDAEGNVHSLSSLIEGKPALLDLWASWCGSCRRTSKTMIPVYDEFSPKGFTIVGVARENGTPDAALHAIEKDGYKWLNLFEIDDTNGIWAIYRRQNAGGGTFLISPEGKIVKSDVTAEEVREYLNSLYSGSDK